MAEKKMSVRFFSCCYLFFEEPGYEEVIQIEYGIEKDSVDNNVDIAIDICLFQGGLKRCFIECLFNLIEKNYVGEENRFFSAEMKKTSCDTC